MHGARAVALGALRRFLRPGASGCEEPEWPRPKAKKREYGGFFRWVFLAVWLQSSVSAGSATRKAKRTLKLVHEGFARSGNRPTLEPLTCCGISEWGSGGSVLQENLFVGEIWDCALLLAD